MPATPSAPGATPQAAPFGQSPVTAPSPNQGFEAAALKQMGLVVDALTAALQKAGASSDLGKDILKAISILNKHVPSGAVTPADKKAQLQRQMMQNNQNNDQIQAMRAQQAKPPGAAGGAAPPQAAA